MTSPHPDNRLASHPSSPRTQPEPANATTNSLSSPTPTGNIRERKSVDESAQNTLTPPEKQSRTPSADMGPPSQLRRARLRSPWGCSLLTLATTALAAALAILIIHSFLGLQNDPKGAAMSYMRPAFAKFPDFDTEHTRFASKYSLYLYREGGVDEDTRVKGIPVLFIPGNAGSYKQVRPVAAEAAVYFHENLRDTDEALKHGKRTLDFFSVDFNEDMTAFHGQTLLDQAEYLNEAIAYILSLYTNPHRSLRDLDLPDPTSVILLGHSMGGIVARTMLSMPNYLQGSVNTILTLAAPHARAPVSFDSEIVSTYKRANGYWRTSFAQEDESQNPLANVATISIAGGGLDTMVPSDYATLSSLVPASNGFTVFTSTMPRVWTAMDHLAITWCNQLRRSLVRSLYEVVDASRPNQTKPLVDRMQAFRRWFLTGMEDVAEKRLGSSEPTTLLTLEDNSNAIKSQGERISIRQFGQTGKPTAQLLPVPPQGSTSKKRFTLLTDQKLDGAKIAVLFCSVFPLQSAQGSKVFSVDLDLSGDTAGSTRLACKNAAADAILLPASTAQSQHPFDDAEPFSYLEYDVEDLADHQFVAVIDKSLDPAPGWVVAEFGAEEDSSVTIKDGLRRLISSGFRQQYSAKRPMVTEITIPALHSSLLTYNIRIKRKNAQADSLFAPLLRQYIANPYESKFFVNVRDVDVNMHGVAPYIPPALDGSDANRGLTLQLWTDPTSDEGMTVTLSVDIIGSMGKLWMRYRTVFAAFPLLVVALVLRKQFQLYDSTGVFMSFTESMDQCLRRSVPVLLVALTFLAVSFSRASQALFNSSDQILGLVKGQTDRAIDFTVNDLLLGSQDLFFWFLIPLFGIISIGICISVNYFVLSVVHGISLAYLGISKAIYKDPSKTTNVFADTSLQKRLIVGTVLLVLVSTVIPYQFVFIVLCIVQIATCVKALSQARETHSGEHMNFYNYTHSIFLLLLWLLPINMPILVVWIRNLAVHWLTPFSSHHNILSILPFLLLVETLSTGKMVPRVSTQVRHLTNVMLFCLAVYAAVYGVTYAYLLHWLVNFVCAWLMALHACAGSIPGLAGLGVAIQANGGTKEERSTKKRP